MYDVTSKLYVQGEPQVRYLFDTIIEIKQKTITRSGQFRIKEETLTFSVRSLKNRKIIPSKWSLTQK